MQRVSYFSDRPAGSGSLRRQLAGAVDVQYFGLESIGDQSPDTFTVVDVSLRQTDLLLGLKEWLRRKPKDGKAIFVIDTASRIEVAQAYSLGATDVVHRPIDGYELLKKLSGEDAELPDSKPEFSTEGVPGVAAAVGSLQAIFSAAIAGEIIDPAVINSAGAAVVGEIEAQGLESWVDTVRKHHSQTYQHCLIVTGVAVAFGQHLGISLADRQRLSFAGMLHDIGKAKIPIEILEKPGPLDQSELVIMRRHPQLGVDTIGPDSGLEPAMIDMVLHHHEYLDGSGYPHGLHASEIPDLVRVMTISDIFGALIERRSYKPPLPSEKAYQILNDMGPKLDKDLVREFGFVSKLDHGLPRVR